MYESTCFAEWKMTWWKRERWQDPPVFGSHRRLGGSAMGPARAAAAAVKCTPRVPCFETHPSLAQCQYTPAMFVFLLTTVRASCTTQME